ncbi:hypothetical protein [Salimicrobium humidisoli]|uniref:hypothetical protein n=1 Tax=Salimicrobium humidisoli TaxID=2029857 RepID=UPI00117BD1FB|nr:hypothetical protein [Salimicrobium humidisoli]
MNWPLIKDRRWVLLQSASILLAVITLILAVNNNNYWVLFSALSMLMMIISASRAAKITHEKTEAAEDKLPCRRQ